MISDDTNALNLCVFGGGVAWGKSQGKLVEVLHKVREMSGNFLKGNKWESCVHVHAFKMEQMGTR